MYEIPLHRSKRQILHIDADAFFASVEQVLNPKLRGKALLVGGPSKDHGIVSAASYEAKKFGIYSGMPIFKARRKCPQAVIVSGHFEMYREFSSRIFDVLCRYTPDVEMASIDEAYLDITGCELMHGKKAAEIAKAILMEVYKKVGVSVSCGMASSKVVAKTASSLNKPHKLTVVPFGKEEAFLAPLPLRALNGIGARTAAKLEQFGFKKIGDISSEDPMKLIRTFGLEIFSLWKRCKGIDDARVISQRPLPKSISKERTFYQLVGEEEALMQMRRLGQVVFAKLRSHRMKTRTVFIRIRYKKEQAGGQGRGRYFEDFSFQRHLSLPSFTDSELLKEVEELFAESVIKSRQIRLVGVGVSGLILNYNLSLFGRDSKRDQFAEIGDYVKSVF